MKHYVLGFFFDAIDGSVILIRKARPDWQKGLLNGIGGSIRPNETPHDAMIREFREETGIVTSIEQWTHYASIDGTTGQKISRSWLMECFYAEGAIPDEFKAYRTDEGLAEAWHLHQAVREDMEPSAAWLYLWARDRSFRGVTVSSGSALEQMERQIDPEPPVAELMDWTRWYRRRHNVGLRQAIDAHDLRKAELKQKTLIKTKEQV